jgi:hypothetical protein
MARKRKGSSKAGRPRKKGERYPSGKLKPQTINEATIAKRAIGDASAGEHPLDFALSKGWVSERQHRDAMAYRATFNRAHGPSGCGPQLALSKLAEVEPSESLKVSWSTMGDAEIVAIFDKVFNVRPEDLDRERAEAAALAAWRLMNAALTSREREELFMVCVLGSWPFWMPKRANDHALGSQDKRKQLALLTGLEAIGKARRTPRRDIGTITPVPFVSSRYGRAEAGVRYETEEGEEIQPRSEHGHPFEVTILRRRA